MQASNLVNFEKDLVTLAYAYPSADASLSTEERKAQLKKIDAILENASLFTPLHLPEIFYLQERVSRLTEKNDPRHALIITQIKRLTEEKIKIDNKEVNILSEVACLSTKIEKLKPTDPFFSKMSKALDDKVRIYTELKYEKPSVIQKLFKEFSEMRSKEPLRSWSDFIRTVRTMSPGESDTMPGLFQKKIIQEAQDNGVDIERLLKESRPAEFKSKIITHLLKTLTNEDYFPDVKPEEITDEMRRQALLNKIYVDCQDGKRYPVHMIINKKDLYVTFLGLAALLGAHSTVRMLLEKGYPINEPDNQGFTPAQMAALIPDIEMLALLSEFGADFQMRNRFGANVFDLLKARGFAKIDKSQHLEFFKGEKVTIAEIEQRLKRKYYPESVFNAESFLHRWYTQMEIPDFADRPYEKGIEEAFIKIKERGFYQPPIHLHKMDVGPDGKPSPLAGHFEVRASRDIEPNEVVLEYTGDVLDTVESTSMSYKVAVKGLENLVIDGEKGGSFAEIINHGPPNCRLLYINYKGTPRMVIYANRKIEAGEPLYWDYGRKYFDFYPFHELAPKSVDGFINKTQGLENIGPLVVYKKLQYWCSSELYLKRGVFEYVANIITEKVIKDKRLQSHYSIDMLSYLLNFPQRLLELIDQGKVKATTVLALLSFIKHNNLYESFNLDEKGILSLKGKITVNRQRK